MRAGPVDATAEREKQPELVPVLARRLAEGVSAGKRPLRAVDFLQAPSSAATS